MHGKQARPSVPDGEGAFGLACFFVTQHGRRMTQNFGMI